MPDEASDQQSPDQQPADKLSPDKNRLRGPHLSLETTEPMAFGHGWISGLLSAVLGIVALGAVICFYYPTFLTMPELRRYYVEHMVYVRALLHVFLVGSFLLGTISICRRQNKTLASRVWAVWQKRRSIRISASVPVSLSPSIEF